jgi:hypothetical protein
MKDIGVVAEIDITMVRGITEKKNMFIKEQKRSAEAEPSHF